MKISVVGGGPAGLYFSLLAKKRRPEWDITVYEQNDAASTFGFGVVLAESGLDRLRSADEDTHADLVSKMTFTSHQVITQKETPVSVRRPTRGGGAIARVDLLLALQKAAARVGVRLAFNQRVDSTGSAPWSGADIVIGADGINSSVRSEYETEFGTTKEVLSNHFAWFGVGKAFAHSALVFRAHQGGAFVAHYYPYSATHSTFVAECDHAAWQIFGMDALDADARRRLFETVFAPELGGEPLISNNSTWRQFPVIRNATAVFDNKVLLGDSETSAHFSIGSGTRIAMDDAMALADVLTQESASGPDAAARGLRRYWEIRGPEKAKLISASRNSYLWYEDMARWMREYTPLEFVHAFMTRTGRVSEERLAASYPELYAQIKGTAPV